MSTIKAEVAAVEFPHKVTATISSGASTYIPPFIKEHIGSTSNPHEVTCNQIGAMPYDKDIVSDADYVHTDNNFDDTYKAKLDSIELGSISSSNIFSNEYKSAIDNLPNNYTNNRNISDAATGSIIGNDIETNVIQANNYISDGVYLTEPHVVSIMDDKIAITTSGYYAMPNEWFEIGGKDYRLYKVEADSPNIGIDSIIANGDQSGAVLVTKQYKLEPKNVNILGSHNTTGGKNSIVLGEYNINSGDNGITMGDSNVNDNGDSIVCGLNNYNEGAQSAIFGAQNKNAENQGFVTGYHNQILDGAYFATATGVGNINQGTATTTMGAYNMAGSQYSTAEGLCNIAGGDLQFDGKHLMDIASYSSTSNYLTGDICKRNGYVYRALVDIAAGEYIPNPLKYLDKWEIVPPEIAIVPATASHASGVNCIAKHHGAFVHGYRLQSGRDYQTIVGKYNSPSANALFGVGNGTASKTSNAFEVKNDGSSEFGGDILLNKKSAANKTITMSQNGLSQLELKANTSHQGVLSGRNGIYVRPYFLSGSSKAGAIKLDNNQIIPETSSAVNVGSTSNRFNSGYYNGTIFANAIAPINNVGDAKTISDILTNVNKIESMETSISNNSTNISNLQSDITNHTTSISNLQSSLNSKADASSVPTFTLNGTTLTITTN